MCKLSIRAHKEKYCIPQGNAPTIDLTCQPISSVTDEPEVTSAISNINIWSDCQKLDLNSK